MSATTAERVGSLPSGVGICRTAPDILYIPELICGGLVWILVASTLVIPANPQGWVMFVSIFCFIVTFLWLVVFACEGHKNSQGWAAADCVYHAVAVILYLSASVSLAKTTIDFQTSDPTSKTYKIDIAAVVFSFLATLFYFIHLILSAIRWKTF
ncbi:hypothetical protein COCON_G00224280 [Conger conger]|uniref:MARVEL domain-containing protein n=1 Tax=Conger conger TaxID=82655 RepID=A0A9Q1CWH1_CONCO|nr:hypothetical protein COCON_G00224280 [Conger conger]